MSARASALRLFPVAEPLPAKVAHLVVDGTETASGTALTVTKYLAKTLGDEGVDETYAEELLDIGAVWFATAQPPRALRGVPRTARARRLTRLDVDAPLRAGQLFARSRATEAVSGGVRGRLEGVRVESG